MTAGLAASQLHEPGRAQGPPAPLGIGTAARRHGAPSTMRQESRAAREWAADHQPVVTAEEVDLPSLIRLAVELMFGYTETPCVRRRTQPNAGLQACWE